MKKEAGKLVFAFLFLTFGFMLIGMVSALDTTQDCHLGGGEQCSGDYGLSGLCSKSGLDTHYCVCTGNGKACTKCDDKLTHSCCYKDPRPESCKGCAQVHRTCSGTCDTCKGGSGGGGGGSCSPVVGHWEDDPGNTGWSSCNLKGRQTRILIQNCVGASCGGKCDVTPGWWDMGFGLNKQKTVETRTCANVNTSYWAKLNDPNLEINRTCFGDTVLMRFGGLLQDNMVINYSVREQSGGVWVILKLFGLTRWIDFTKLSGTAYQPYRIESSNIHKFEAGIANNSDSVNESGNLGVLSASSPNCNSPPTAKIISPSDAKGIPWALLTLSCPSNSSGKDDNDNSRLELCDTLDTDEGCDSNFNGQLDAGRTCGSEGNFSSWVVSQSCSNKEDSFINNSNGNWTYHQDLGGWVYCHMNGYLWRENIPCTPQDTNYSEICDTLDNDRDGAFDEGCDDDHDGKVDLAMNCSGSFYSWQNNSETYTEPREWNELGFFDHGEIRYVKSNKEPNPQIDYYKTSVGKNINFKQISEDEDDLLRVSWNFGDGTTYSVENYSRRLDSGKADKLKNYSVGGRFYTVVLTAQEMIRGQMATDSINIYVFKEGINVVPIISSPQRGLTLPTHYLVWFNASQSYVANCSHSMTSSDFNAGDLRCKYLLAPGSKTPEGKVEIRWRETNDVGTTLEWIKGDSTGGIAWNETNYGDSSENLNGSVVFPKLYPEPKQRKIFLDMRYCFVENCSKEICDAEDNDGDGTFDEGCDDDYDRELNSTAICPFGENFYSWEYRDVWKIGRQWDNGIFIDEYNIVYTKDDSSNLGSGWGRYTLSCATAPRD